MNKFKSDFKRVADSMSVTHAAYVSEKYISRVCEEIDRCVQEIERIGNTSKPIHFIKGDVVEPWHAGTARIADVTRNGGDACSVTVPRDASPVDIRVEVSASDFIEAQVKYYQTAASTAKSISRPDYLDLMKIVPHDQLEQVKEEAYRLFLKNQDSRPDIAKSYFDTYERATDCLEYGDIRSRPITEADALKLAEFVRDNRDFSNEFGLKAESFIGLSNILNESVCAATNAAIISAVVRVAPYIFDILRDQLANRKVSKDRLSEVLKVALQGGGSGALRAGLSAAITLMCKSGHLGKDFLHASPTVIAGATVVAINSIERAFDLYNSRITPEEFAECALKDIFVVSGSLIGASIGQSILPVPYIGALFGNFVGSIIASAVYGGTKEFCIGIAVTSGFSFFNIVEQNYSVDRAILEHWGIDLINLQEVELTSVALETVALETVAIEVVEFKMIDIKPLKRGLIKINVVGYI